MSIPSIIRSVGTVPPPASTRVGNRLTSCTISLLTLPAGTLPGQRTMHGVRFELSSEVNSEPRHGPENPFHNPPNGSGSPAGSR